MENRGQNPDRKKARSGLIIVV